MTDLLTYPALPPWGSHGWNVSTAIGWIGHDPHCHHLQLWSCILFVYVCQDFHQVVLVISKVFNSFWHVKLRWWAISIKINYVDFSIELNSILLKKVHLVTAYNCCYCIEMVSYSVMLFYCLWRIAGLALIRRHGVAIPICIREKQDVMLHYIHTASHFILSDQCMPASESVWRRYKQHGISVHQPWCADTFLALCHLRHSPRHSFEFLFTFCWMYCCNNSTLKCKSSHVVFTWKADT